MVITETPCQRCGGPAACTRQELYVLRGDICWNCRTEDEERALATEAYLNAEYEVARLIRNRQSIRLDGSPGTKLAMAMAQRDHHLAKVIGGPVIPALVSEVRPEPRRPLPRPIHKALMVTARRLGILRR